MQIIVWILQSVIICWKSDLLVANSVFISRSKRFYNKGPTFTHQDIITSSTFRFAFIRSISDRIFGTTQIRMTCIRQYTLYCRSSKLFCTSNGRKLCFSIFTTLYIPSLLRLWSSASRCTVRICLSTKSEFSWAFYADINANWTNNTTSDRAVGQRKLTQRVAEKFSLLRRHRRRRSRRKEPTVLLFEGGIVVEGGSFGEFARRRFGIGGNERRTHWIRRLAHALYGIGVLIEFGDDSVEVLFEGFVCGTWGTLVYHHWFGVRRCWHGDLQERCYNRLLRYRVAMVDF